MTNQNILKGHYQFRCPWEGMDNDVWRAAFLQDAFGGRAFSVLVHGNIGTMVDEIDDNPLLSWGLWGFSTQAVVAHIAAADSCRVLERINHSSFTWGQFVLGGEGQWLSKDAVKDYYRSLDRDGHQALLEVLHCFDDGDACIWSNPAIDRFEKIARQFQYEKLD